VNADHIRSLYRQWLDARRECKRATMKRQEVLHALNRARDESGVPRYIFWRVARGVRGPK
jgi:hypothetical protein